jgi:hypothetical protein
VGLQAVAKPAQQILQSRRQIAQALGRPQQRRLRVTPGRRLDQPAKVIEQRGIPRHEMLASAVRAAHPASHYCRAAAQSRNTVTDRAARNASDLRYQAPAATPCRQCLGGSEPPTNVSTGSSVS